MTKQEEQVKILWLNRYKYALEDVERLHDALEYARQAATALPSGCNTGFRASSSAHSDRTAHSAEKIVELERRLAKAQQAAVQVRDEISRAAYNSDAMSAKAAQALLCRYVYGLPDKEAAQLIGCAASSVKRYRRDAIEALTVPQCA